MLNKIPDTEVLKKAWMQSMQTVLKLAQLRWTGHGIGMPDELLPKKVSMQNGGQALSRWPEETLQRHPQTSLKDFDLTNKVLWTACTGEVSSQKEQLTMKKGESVTLKESAKNAKPKPMGHQQIP